MQMQRLYRAVLTGHGTPREVMIMAGSDFDALTQAKQALGANFRFDL